MKEYSQGKNLKVLLYRTPFARQFFVRMKCFRTGTAEWPADGRPVSLSKIFASLRKAVVRKVEG